MEHQFLIGTFHLEKQDFLLDILLLPKIFHWNDEKSHVSYFTMSFQQDFSEAFCKWWTTSDSLSSLQSMAGARSSFFKKFVRNKGLKTALHVGDLVEFCHTLQTGSSPSQSSPAAKSMWHVLFTSIFFLFICVVYTGRCCYYSWCQSFNVSSGTWSCYFPGDIREGHQHDHTEEG